MMELSEEEQEQVQRFLNSIPPEDLNLVALDRKYTLEWYQEQLQALEELEEFYAEAGEIMSLADQTDAKEFMKKQRYHIVTIIRGFNNIIDNLEETDNEQYGKSHYDI